MKVQVSPGLASPSSPSEQSIAPLSGAVSGGHVTISTKWKAGHLIRHILTVYTQKFFKNALLAKI